MTEAGETDGMSAFDHVRMLHTHLGLYPDVTLINSQQLDESRREAYEREQATAVSFDAREFEQQQVRYVLLDLLASGEQAYHDSDVLADWLVHYARQQQTDGWARPRLN